MSFLTPGKELKIGLYVELCHQLLNQLSGFICSRIASLDLQLVKPVILKPVLYSMMSKGLVSTWYIIMLSNDIWYTQVSVPQKSSKCSQWGITSASTTNKLQNTKLLNNQWNGVFFFLTKFFSPFGSAMLTGNSYWDNYGVRLCTLRVW